MGHYTGKTIAFSHKGGFWKTRYSYTPTCYASIDNTMISNNTALDSSYSNTSDIFWEHEVNDMHNNFYNSQYMSGITVISNQDPSAVKLFKALSLESSSRAWTGEVSTHIHQSPVTNNELQRGDLLNFITKEGTQYVNIPKSQINSTSHISYVCEILDIGEIGGEAESPITAQAISQNASIPEIVSGQYGWDVSVVTTPNSSFPCGYGTIALFSDVYNMLYMVVNSSQEGSEGSWRFVEFDPNSTTTGSFNPVGGGDFGIPISHHALFIHTLNSDGTLKLAYRGNEGQFISIDGIANLFTGGGGISIPDTLVQWQRIQLFSVSDPRINGDPMRGHYLKLDLYNSQIQPVETYAINVDFENTKLDHSKPAIKKTKATPTKKASRRSK
tara:strand:+ start:11587 stop:12744 length:1158 start_codon:yes stop_codon:yes gene_type:complete